MNWRNWYDSQKEPISNLKPEFTPQQLNNFERKHSVEDLVIR
jgi:hypothetical protein